ncbi:MAG: uroporphyrinogen decarboxylase family protein [Promethearchaeota archaeon]
MEPRERVLATLKHHIPDRIPIDLGGPANSISKEVCENLLQHLQLPRQKIFIWNPVQQLVDLPQSLLRNFNVDTRHVHAASPKIMQSEQSSIYIDWLGLRYQQRGTIFSIESPPLEAAKTHRDIDRFTWPKFRESWFTPAAPIAKSHSQAGYAVIADPSCSGIFEMGCMLMGWPRFLSAILRNPELAAYLMDKALDLNISFWENFLSIIGDYTQIVIVGDDYGMESGPFMSPQLFQQLIHPRLAQLVKAIKRIAKVSVLLHSCGAIKPLIPSLIKADIDVLSPIQPTAKEMSATNLKEQFGENLTFHGGIDLHQLQTLSIQKAIHFLKRQLGILGVNSGYIFSLSHTVVDSTHLEYLQAAIQAASQFYYKKM